MHPFIASAIAAEIVRERAESATPRASRLLPRRRRAFARRRAPRIATASPAR
jgi:hypothetical protein